MATKPFPADLATNTSANTPNPTSPALTEPNAAALSTTKHDEQANSSPATAKKPGVKRQSSTTATNAAPTKTASLVAKKTRAAKTDNATNKKPNKKSAKPTPALTATTADIPTKDNTASSTAKVATDIVHAIKTDPTTRSDVHKKTKDSTVASLTSSAPNTRNNATILAEIQSENEKQDAPAPTLPLKELVKQYDSVALLLQGGGALGAYQAGIYEGLHKQGIKIDRISGISIGALNTAIIAGNLPQNRLAALKGFWETITQRNYTPAGFNVYRQMANNLDKMSNIDAVSHFMPWIFENGFLKQQLRALESSTEAFQTMMEGQRGFFKPRYFMPFDTTPNHLSYYTTDKLRETLEKYCDLNLVNDVKRMKVSVSAVNVRTGNFAIFSNENEELHYDHFIASGALPPGFPAVEIDGEFYWDGGMVSNTPLNEILSHEEHLSQLIFQVDLWDARGLVPENMLEIDERVKDIQYSSKTRMVTDFMAQKLRYTRLIKDLLQIIETNTDMSKIDQQCMAKALDMTDVGVKNVIHLIYHKKSYERGYKDYEFSANSMLDHWTSGLEDIENTFRHPDWFGLPETDEIFVTHDIHQKRKKLSQMNRV